MALSLKIDVIAKAKDALGERCAGLFDECAEHVAHESVLVLSAEVRRQQPHLTVTIGGGTTINTVRAMLMALAEGIHRVKDFDRVRIRVGGDDKRVVPVDNAPPLRQISVPTTLSGAGFSSRGVATDRTRQVKDLYHSRPIGGQVVIPDAAVTVHTLADLWLSIEIRAVDHAVETNFSRTALDISSPL